MKINNALIRQTLVLSALAVALSPVSLYAGVSTPAEPMDTSSASSGWHYGTDTIDFFEGAGLRGMPIGEMSFTSVFDGDYDNLPGKVSANEFSVFAPILPLSNGRLRFLAYLSYTATEFDTSVPNLLPTDTLHSLSMPIALLYDQSDKWMFGAMIMPGISGDMENTNDAFSFSAFAGFGYKAAPNLRWLGGVFYTDGFGDDLIVPGVGVMWNPSPDWSVTVLPPFAEVSWRFQENYLLSLFARYSSTTWNVENDAAGPNRDVNMTSTRVGLRLERRLSELLWAQVSAGYVLGREMQIESPGNTTLQKDDIDPAPFVQIGLNLRY